MLSSNCFAGKIKSANSLLPKIESDIQNIQSVIADIKTYINGVGETGSFVKNDFWGIKPAFYLNNYNSGITSLYFLHRPVDRRVEPRIKNKYFLRTINNIKLNPGKTEAWGVSLDFDYNDLYPNSGTSYYIDSVKKSFLSNGVPVENIDTAVKEYIEVHANLLEIFSNAVLIDVDKLYSNVYVGELAVSSEALFTIFDQKIIHDMSLHPEIIKNNLDGFRLSSLREAYRLKTDDEFFKAIAIGKISDGHLRFDISNVRYTFEVAKYLDSSQQTSQIIDFDLLLNKKTEQGRAVKSKIERGGDRGFTAYSDTKSSVKYPSTIYFNKETGRGIWENGYWKSEDELKKISARLDEANTQFLQSSEKYLEMVKKEIANKYAVKVDPKSFTDEF